MSALPLQTNSKSVGWRCGVLKIEETVIGAKVKDETLWMGESNNTILLLVKCSLCFQEQLSSMCNKHKLFYMNFFLKSYDKKKS